MGNFNDDQNNLYDCIRLLTSNNNISNEKTDSYIFGAFKEWIVSSNPRIGLNDKIISTPFA